MEISDSFAKGYGLVCDSYIRLEAGLGRRAEAFAHLRRRRDRTRLLTEYLYAAGRALASIGAREGGRVHRAASTR